MSNYQGREYKEMKVSFSKKPNRHSLQEDDSDDENDYTINGRKRAKLITITDESGQSGSGDSGVIRFEVESEKQVSEGDIVPWMSKNTRSIGDSLLRLHNQIIEFYNYIKPSKKSHAHRMAKFSFLKSKIEEMLPGVEVLAFGSFATQLYLPDGDIDVAVLTHGRYDVTETYNRIHRFIASKSNASIFTNIQYIRKSKVPLIKFHFDDIHVDISVDKQDGLAQIKYVEKITAFYPQFKYLTLLFKCTLRIRGLGDTYTGGIGSFLLSCLLLVYLQHCQEKKHYYNLAEHTIEFMRFYALRGDDWWERRVVLVKTGRIVDRRPDSIYFSCISPQDDSHDIGRSAYKIRDVFKVLRNRCEYIIDKNFMPGESVLRALVNPSDQCFRYIREE